MGSTLLLTAFSVTVYRYVAYRLALPIDYELRNDLEVVAKNLDITPAGTLKWAGQPLRPDTPWPKTNPWLEIWNNEGKLIRRLWPLKDEQLQRLPSAPATGREVISIFSVAPDLRIRALSVPFARQTANGWTIRVLRPHAPRSNALGELLLINLVALPVVIALLVIGGYAVTRHWLKPLDHLVGAARRISAEDLSRRLPVANPDDELGVLAIVFNETLARLENSFTALDQFVGNASHELRTPLTTLRAVGELGLRRGRTVEAHGETISSMLEEAHRLQTLVERLLELAAAEAGAPGLRHSTVALHEHVAECVEELSVLAEQKHQQIKVQTCECSIETDPVIFRQAFYNLVDNAIKYSPEGAQISISVTDHEGNCRVDVTDNGPGIPAPEVSRITDRFYRVDGSRARSRGGFGLGLAITKAYARILRGSLQYEPAVPHGSTFRLTLPKSG